jgi:phosphate transport system substrate-binding protein
MTPSRWRYGLMVMVVVSVVLAVPFLGAPTPASAGGTPISGGGSSFAALEIDQWRADTARTPYNLSVNYVSQGSSFGRQQFITNNLDYGASDIIFQQVLGEIGQLQGGRCAGQALPNCFVYVPVSAGGVSFMYNKVLPSGARMNNLQLTRDQACRIFTGAITTWGQLASDNPSLAGDSSQIVPIIRSDGAGESYVLSQFCIAVDPAVWQAFIADRKAHDPQNVAPDFAAGLPVSNWPQNWGHSNPVAFGDGVANAVADPSAGQNAITYTAAGYAKVRNFPVASVQNAAGVFTQPTEENVTVALGYASPQNDPSTNTVGTFALNFFGADPRAYFPSTYSYILAQTGGFDAGKGATLGQFLCYAISKGQEIAPLLAYARLSAPLVQIAIDAITKIPGAPPASSCFLAGAAPPPGAPTVASGTANPNANAATAAAAAAAAASNANKNAAASLNSKLANDAATAPANKDSWTTESAILTLLVGSIAAAIAIASRRRLAR